MQPPILLTKNDLKEGRIYQGISSDIYLEVKFFLAKINDGKESATILKKDGIEKYWYLFDSRRYIELA
jgi:hypothetical protein